jgi:YbbR domain-containing protein
MPFQDVDEVSKEVAHAPSGVEKLLRKLFVEDWSLKLLSLGITLVLWLLVTGQNEPVTTHVNIQLNFVRPQSLEISNDPPKIVDVTLTGSRSKLDNLSVLDLVATVDLTDQPVGEHVIRLSDKAMISLPHGVNVDAFLPSAIPIRLETIIEKELPAEPRFEGKPAEGYEVYSGIPNQSTVTVRGPASHVNPLGNAPTETIWIAGQKDSFTASNVAIDIQDPKVDLVDPAVDVQVVIGEKRVEKNFSGVVVVGPHGSKVEPRTASVTILGPSHLLDTLKSEQLQIVLNDALEPNLDLGSGLQGKLILKTVNPAKFTLGK